MTRACSFCEIEGHTVRTCKYKQSLPPIHTVMGDNTLCGIPNNMMPKIPTKVVHMKERSLCPACTHETEQMRKRRKKK